MLTPARIKAEPTPARGVRKLTDGDGLYLLLTPNGRRAWRFKFRYAGKENSLSFGPYPEVPIEVARERAGEARAQLRRGENPAAAKREAREAIITDAMLTFGRVGAEYLKLDSTKAPKTAKKHQWLFDRLAKFHNRPLSSIETLEIVTACRSLEAAGKRETAHRLAAFASRVYRYAMQSGYVRQNPASELRGALKPIESEPRAAIVDPGKFAILMRYIDSDNYSSLPTRHALRLLARVACRPGELRAMEWSEIDMAKAEWTIPAARAKMRKPHWVPLSRQALEILKAQHAISGEGRYVFPHERTERRPMSDGTLSAALAVLGYNKGGWLTIDPHQPHGFRSSFSTLMNELDENPVVIELCLAHGDEDKIAAIYNRSERRQKRRDMMQRWADYIDELKTREKQT